MIPMRRFGFLLKDLSRLYSLNFERHAFNLNMSLVQCRVLCYLQRNEGISQARLAYLTDTDPMTLVRILNRMEKNGLIARRLDPDDRRARRLFLESPANPILKKIWRVSDRARAETLAGLSSTDRTQLVSLMQSVYNNLDALIPSAANSKETVTRPTKKRALALAKDTES